MRIKSLSLSSTQKKGDFICSSSNDPLAVCTLAATPFEQVVPLEVSNLSPATYTVNANGVVAIFELLSRDAAVFQRVLVDALNRRDYELQKILNGDWLVFNAGPWESQQSMAVNVSNGSTIELGRGTMPEVAYDSNH